MTIRLLLSRIFQDVEECSVAGLFYAHIWNMFCKIQFVINLQTKYFHSFCGRCCCIFIIYHHIINPSTSKPWHESTIVWNFSGLAFKEFSLNQFIKNNVLCWELSNVINCVPWIQNAVIIGIVVDVTITIKNECINITNTLYNTGHKMEPWVTPLATVLHSLLISPNLYLWWR